jgi:nucleoside-diphosphate-sugar epimerase|uniref:NAD-dependent epimerase/dehydratase family protein n=1 Tax=Prosthecobacter sp. TaxID=1965333 RepID=UPI00378340EF
MKIFVTGATGFIGRAFCAEAIRRGHRLLALTRDPAAQIAADVEVAIGSLSETPWDQVTRFAPEAALHLAWIAEPGVYLKSPENEVWLEQSKAWFRKLMELGVPYLAGTGTCIEYAPSTEPLNEEQSPLAPQFPYSKAKAALCEWLRGHATGDWAWFRIFYPYGPGEHANRVCTSLLTSLRTGRPLALRTPDSVKDYLYIDDLAEALCVAMEGRHTGAINIGSGRGVAIRDLAALMAELTNASPQLVRQAAELAHDSSPVTVADMRRLKQAGWCPKTSLKDGLQHLIDSLLVTA